MKKSVILTLISAVAFVGITSSVSAMIATPTTYFRPVAVDTFGSYIEVLPKGFIELSGELQAGLQHQWDGLDFVGLQRKLGDLVKDPATATATFAYCAKKADETNHPIFMQPILDGLMRKAFNTPTKMSPSEKKVLLKCPENPVKGFQARG